MPAQTYDAAVATIVRADSVPEAIEALRQVTLMCDEMAEGEAVQAFIDLRHALHAFFECATP